MTDTQKPTASGKQPPIRWRLGLIVAAIFVIVIAVLLVIFGKLIIAGLLGLLGAVFGVASQVVTDDVL